MNKKMILIMVTVALFASGCPNPVVNAKKPVPGWSPGGVKKTIQTGSEEFVMIYVQNLDSVTFPIYKDTNFSTLKTKFWMGETEVTNAVFAAVYQWAYDNDKFNTTDSSAANYLDTSEAQHGHQNLLDLTSPDCHVKYANGQFTVDSGFKNHPIMKVSWYGAVMFCNWLTEMVDGNKDNVFHTWDDTKVTKKGTPNDGIWQDEETSRDTNRSGFRLPLRDEWEYAARYRGKGATENVVTKSITHAFFTDKTVDFSAMELKWTTGESASGATVRYNDVGTGTDGEPARSVNDKLAVYLRYEIYKGKPKEKQGITDEAEVKSLGPESANTLGLYDMSGNVWEWTSWMNKPDDVYPDPPPKPGFVYDIVPYTGGCWDGKSKLLIVGSQWATHATKVDGSIGFRLCRTEPE